jgi:hypothetical protein
MELIVTTQEMKLAEINYWLAYYTLQLATEVMSERDTKWAEERLAIFTAARIELAAQPVTC